MSDTTETATDFIDFEEQLSADLRNVFAAGKWLAVSEGAAPAIGLATRIAATANRSDTTATMALSAFGGDEDASTSAVHHVGLGLPSPSNLLEGIQTAQKAYESLPEEAQAAVDRWDPDGLARAVLPFTATARSVGGRRSFGVTREEWKQLEDKLAVIDIWNEAGIEVAPFEIVDLSDPSAGLNSHERLATQQGSVWAVDNQSGWHGGADGTFWIRTGGDVADFMTSRRGRNERARVMPFLSGVPCSVHGMVFDDQTISFLPCEMMTFLDTVDSRFHYARSSTFWRPGETVRAAMQSAAERVGDILRRRVGFRGVFTLDGVADEVSFKPTEINPRFGAALPMLHQLNSGQQLSMFLLHVCVVEGVLPDLDPRELERWVRFKMSERPEARLMTPVSHAPGVSAAPATGNVRILSVSRAEQSIHSDDIRFVSSDAGVVGEGATLLGSFEWRPRGDDEGLAFIHFEPGSLRCGPPLAPVALAVLQAAQRRWNIGLGELTPACTAA